MTQEGMNRMDETVLWFGILNLFIAISFSWNPIFPLNLFSGLLCIYGTFESMKRDE